MSVMHYVERVLAIVGGLASLGGLYLAWVYWQWQRRLRSEPTWDDALRVAENVLESIQESGFNPHLVVGLGRSGGIWGGWLAGNLGTLPFALIDVEKEDEDPARRIRIWHGEEVLSYIPGYIQERSENKTGKPRVLVVEGAATAGTTFREFLAKFKSQLSEWDVKTAVLYKRGPVDVRIDFFGKDDLYPWPKRFPWHKRAAYKPHLRYIFERAQDVAPGVAST